MKKKILALSLALGVFALILSAGTLAYFTDSKSATNTFTVGNVKIELKEQQRKIDDNGNKTTELEAFEQGKTLMPIVGSAQGEKDALGMPVAENYVDKIVTVKNIKKSAAWVRAYFAIPSALDDGYETFNASVNALHFNFGNENGATTFGTTWNWAHDGKWNYYETEIDGVKYNVYFADYVNKLEEGQETTQMVQGLYLDVNVNVNESGNLTYKGSDLGVSADSEIKCPVFAVAVQSDGFENADEAVKAAFGDKYNPWGGAVENWQ